MATRPVKSRAPGHGRAQHPNSRRVRGALSTPHPDEQRLEIPFADELDLREENWHRFLTEFLPHIVWSATPDGANDLIS